MSSDVSPVPGAPPPHLPSPTPSPLPIQNPLEKLTPPPPINPGVPLSSFFDKDTPPTAFWERLKEDPLDPFWLTNIKDKIVGWGSTIYEKEPKVLILFALPLVIAAMAIYPYLKLPQLILSTVPYIGFICALHVASGGSVSDLTGLFDVIKMFPIKPPSS